MGGDARQKARDEYWVRRRAGICTECGRVATENGQGRCNSCRLYQNAAKIHSDAKRYETALKLGICVVCKQVRANYGVRCWGCREKQMPYNKAIPKRRRPVLLAEAFDVDLTLP